MRAGRTLLLAAGVVAMSGCSLLLDTGGLNGGDDPAAPGPGPGPGADAGASDAPVTTVGEAGAMDPEALLTGGGDHSCAVVRGVASCWGSNARGELGDGTKVPRLAAVPVKGLPVGTVSDIAAGLTHSCAIVDGDAWCWGSGTSGELGNGAKADSTTAVKVTGLPAGKVVDVSCGNHFTCAATDDGLAFCWGTNAVGQLGNASNGSAVPVGVVTSSGLITSVKSIRAGGDHACAVRETGEVMCWGHNDDGAALGNPAAGDSSQLAIPVQGLPGPASLVSYAGWHACALVAEGAWCWGRGTAGELGNGAKQTSEAPVAVVGLDSDVSPLEVAGGPDEGDATCAVRDGRVLCWGNGQYGRLGDGGTTARAAPVEVTTLPGPAKKLAGGVNHFCALLTSGEIRCWGRGTSGQLGDGTGQDRGVPVAVLGL